MTARALDTLSHVWPRVASIVSVPHSECAYDQLVHLRDALIDGVGEDERYPLAALMDVVGVRIETYADEHVPELL